MNTFKSTIGIDKVKIYVPEDFQVVETSRSGLQLFQGTVDLTTGATVETDLFTDRSGNRVVGTKAVRNENLYNLTINSHGLTLEFNPSKPYHKYHLVDDDDDFRSRFRSIVDDLTNHGIKADWNSAKVTRLDVARNVELNRPVRSYSPVWPWVKMNRAKNVRQYPTGFGTGNNTWGAIFYDKGQEIGQPEINNMLRAELQFKRSRSVSLQFGCKNIGQLKQFGIKEIANVYRKQMTTNVLKLDSHGQAVINFENEVEVLKQLFKENNRTAVMKYIQLMSVSQFIETFGNPDVFGDVLTAAGGSVMSKSRWTTAIRKLIISHNTYYSNSQTTVGNLLEEIRMKIAA